MAWSVTSTLTQTRGLPRRSSRPVECGSREPITWLINPWVWIAHHYRGT
jgi:hypothetical protein